VINNKDINIRMIIHVAKCLGDLRDKVVFVGRGKAEQKVSMKMIGSYVSMLIISNNKIMSTRRH